MGKMIEIRKDEYDRNIVLVPLSDYVAIKRYRIDEAPCYKDYDYKYFLFIEKFDDVERTVLSGELVDYISALEAEVERLKAKNVELRERLEKAIELPYEVGSTVYSICETDEEDKFNPWIDAGRVVSFSIDVNLWIYVRYNSGLTMWYTKDSFDKEVCITFEAAEARLAELQGEQNG